MTKNIDKFIEQRAFDTITEKPESFEIETQDGKTETLYLYPLQLGRLALISRRLLDLDLALDDDDTEGAIKRTWEVCSEKPKVVAEIIAIATLRTKQELENELKDRTDLILWSPTMQPGALVNILSAIVFQSYHEDFMKAIRSVKTLQVMISPTTAAERIATTEDEASGDKSTLS